MIKSLLQMVWEFAKIPLFLFLVFCVVFGFLCLVYGIILYRRGYRFQHGEHHEKALVPAQLLLSASASVHARYVRPKS